MIALGLLRALGLRGIVVLACLLVLAVTAYGVAQDLGLLEAPAKAAPAPKKPAVGQPRPSSAAAADIPPGYLRLYRQAGARYQVPWPVRSPGQAAGPPLCRPRGLAAMTATADRYAVGRSRDELRLVEVASGLLMLLDAYRLTGRLPSRSRSRPADRGTRSSR